MMMEILFRGRMPQTRKWAYGCLLYWAGKAQVWEYDENCYLELIKFIEGENKGCLKKQKRRAYRQGEDNEK